MIKKIFKYSLLLLIIYFLLHSMVGDWQSVWLQTKTVNPLYLTLSFLVALTIYPEAGYAWFKLINKLFVVTKARESVSIWLISNTSRYIPGTIWQYLGRIELGKRFLNLKRQQVLASVAFEALLVLLSASTLACIMIYYLYPGPIYLLSMLSPFILFNKQIFKIVIQLLNKLFNQNFSTNFKLSYLDIYRLLFWFLLNFVLNTASLWLLLLSFNIHLGINDFIYLIGAYSASWLAGYLVVVVPGGLGVVEGVLTVLLVKLSIPAAMGSLLALVYRLLLTIGELVIFIFVYIKGGWSEKKT